MSTLLYLDGDKDWTEVSATHGIYIIIKSLHTNRPLLSGDMHSWLCVAMIPFENDNSNFVGIKASLKQCRIEQYVVVVRFSP